MTLNNYYVIRDDMNPSADTSILINIDVFDLERATRFYIETFALRVGRKLGDGVVELLGLPAPIYLLEKATGTMPFKGAKRPRDEHRHWTPVHLDFVVASIQKSIEKAVACGATLENDVEEAPWGKIAMLSDPFGNGFCLIQFTGRGYDEIAQS